MACTHRTDAHPRERAWRSGARLSVSHLPEQEAHYNMRGHSFITASSLLDRLAASPPQSAHAEASTAGPRSVPEYELLVPGL